jgi:hypothetical protein
MREYGSISEYDDDKDQQLNPLSSYLEVQQGGHVPSSSSRSVRRTARSLSEWTSILHIEDEAREMKLDYFSMGLVSGASLQLLFVSLFVLFLSSFKDVGPLNELSKGMFVIYCRAPKCYQFAEALASLCEIKRYIETSSVKISV